MILKDEGVFFCGASILFLVHGLSQLIDQEEQSDEFTIDAYDQLLRMQARESNVLACLATKLRLTQQVKYTTKAAGTASNNAGLGPKPWEPLTNA